MVYIKTNWEQLSEQKKLGLKLAVSGLLGDNAEWLFVRISKAFNAMGFLDQE